MHLVYVDDSHDNELGVFSALAVPADQWRVVHAQVREFRRELRRAYGIYVFKELHAWKFISGRGRPSDRVVTKSQRCAIFRGALELAARLPGVRLFNTCFPVGDQRAFEWLVNRLNRTLQAWGSYGLLICDQGNEAAYTALLRRMAVFNPIPSQFGGWPQAGRTTMNIPVDRLVEDPFFKSSDQSYFLQLVDFAAFALLRRERPTEHVRRYGLETAFTLLDPIFVREARPRDPEGIIRP